jgi:hypothetical protein
MFQIRLGYEEPIQSIFFCIQIRNTAKKYLKQKTIELKEFKYFNTVKLAVRVGRHKSRENLVLKL